MTGSHQKPSSPLAGVKVLDLTSVVFGPYATQILGDLGADVIKVESPEGDTTRYTGPARSEGMAALFMGVNRNKRSIVLDLKQPEGVEALMRLIEQADVFVHSIRPQKIDRLGLGPEAVMSRNPRIIYAGLLGYGPQGRYSGLPAYDDVIQGQAGVVSLMSEIAGEPRYAPMIIGDKTCALMAAYAINAALFARERTGEGQLVQVPMFESLVSFNLIEHLAGHCFMPPDGPLGYSRVLAPWRRPYPTADGHICMLAYTDAQWDRFWELVDRPDIKADTRFRGLSNRARNIGELYRTAGEMLTTRPTAEWLDIFKQAEIPCAQIMSLDELAEDPHLADVGFFHDADHPSEGGVRLPSFPVGFGDQPWQVSRLQPRLGEHSVEILAEADFSNETIADLLRRGVTTAGLQREAAQ